MSTLTRVLILVGCSGSGKSTFVARLQAALRETASALVVCSADTYPGLYTRVQTQAAMSRWEGDPIDAPARFATKIDPSKLGDAHADCFRRFILACQATDDFANREATPGIDPCDFIVCDNTNSTPAEIAPYIQAARAFDLEPEIVVLHSDDHDPARLASRNVHGCPEPAIRGQQERIRDLLDNWPPFWPTPASASTFDAHDDPPSVV